MATLTAGRRGNKALRVGIGLILAPLLAAPARAHAAQDGTRLVLLGTGTPNADPDRSGPAVAVVVGGAAYLVDAGPGIVRRAAAARRQGIEALDAPNLQMVFLTHLHSDHTAGLPDLIFSPWVLGRDVALQVYGPPGVTQMVEHLEAAYREDVRIRLNGLEPANPMGYQAEPHEVEPGLVYQDARVKVFAFAVKHGSWPHAYGYKFVTSDRTIVISGDTAPVKAVVQACDGCDVLVHEVYSQAGFARRPPEWQRYHASFHSSTAELARIAAQARPKLLVLYHQLSWGATDEELLDEIRAGYAGPVVSGHDLDVF